MNHDEIPLLTKVVLALIVIGIAVWVVASIGIVGAIIVFVFIGYRAITLNQSGDARGRDEPGGDF